MIKQKIARLPNFAEALIIFFAVILGVSLSIIVIGIDTQVALFYSLILSIMFAIYLGYSFNDVEKMMIKGLENSSQMLLFNVFIGMIVSSWIAAGVIPYIIYIGLSWFTPSLVAFWACLLCSIMSMLIGSSWTTGGTVGLAFVVIATTMGIPLPLIVGAVITGSMFGDKQSPLSETTVFAAGTSKVKLMDHVSSMRYTSVPSLVVSLIIYAVLGFRFASTGYTDLSLIENIRSILAESFNFNPLILLLPIGLIILIVKKINALFCLAAAIVAGVIVAMLFQDMSVYGISSTLMTGMSVKSGSDIVDAICAKGGLNSMWFTISIILLGFCMSEILASTRVYETIVNRFSHKLTSAKSIIISSLLVGIILSIGTAAPYVPAMITGACYFEIYNKYGIDRRVLSRTLEDGTTIPQAMVPWCASAMYFSTLFDCSVGAFLPYYLIGYLNPLMAVLCAVTGYGVMYTNHRKGWGKNKYSIEKDGVIPLSVTEKYYESI